jgi:uncharacterized protein (DUF885 family)
LKRLLTAIAICAVLSLTVPAQSATDSIQKLADDFWTWRARFGQYTSDDINRMERPRGIIRDWSAGAVAQQRKELSAFEDRWKQLADAKAPIPQQVDYRLLGSALARVRWELDVLNRWARDPNFYIDQTLTPVAEALTLPGPFDQGSSREILSRLDNIPAIAQEGEKNLSNPPTRCAQAAIDSLSDIRQKLTALAKQLAPNTTIRSTDWQASADRAATALENYRAWLQARLPRLPPDSAIGREKYVWFLRNVALVPYTPEELVERAEQEYRRTVLFHELEIIRNSNVAPLNAAPNVEEWRSRHHQAELNVREFLESRNLLTLPSWLQHFTLRPMPTYLKPLSAFTETDDFTSPSRLDQDSVRYVNAPGPSAPFFWVADAKDPRIQVVHEGTVGHYGQLSISWKHPDPIRRHYYDSGANEGIGFYAEEMMLQAGLYDDSPHTREIVYTQMALRALRQIADVKVALGSFSIDDAAEFLEKTVPMDKETALAEAIEMSEWPGQKISYQTGKLQIEQLMVDARKQQGDQFRLRKFHDYVWLNGNVPFVLQRWEYLGTNDELLKVNDLK